MTPEQLNEIKTRAEMATPGPWQVGGDDSIGLGIENDGFGGFAFDVILAEVTTQSDRDNDMECTPNRNSINLSTIKADAEFIAHAREDVPALVAELEQARRGGKELGKSIVFLTELIKNAYVRGADDPIDALHMLGNVVAEVFEDEGGLSPDEFNRVYRALEARRAEEEKHRREGDEQRRAEVSRSLAETTPGGAR